MQANLTLPVTVQQYFAPTATGFTVYVADALTHIWAIIAPTGTMASGTIVLPATPPNRQLVDVNTTQAITALTINGNGKSVAGGPATLAINGFFRLRYDVVTSTWRQVA